VITHQKEEDALWLAS